MQTHYAKTPEALGEVAKAILETLPEVNDGAVVCALVGDLGAGKTTFVKALGATLGIEENIVSPTFIFERCYPILWREKTRLVHIDAYRIEEIRELDTIAFADRLEDRNNLIFVEWGDQIREALPQHTVWITITPQEDDAREITVADKP